jgi:ABC-type glycerol-3-phosphate transport system permease component
VALAVIAVSTTYPIVFVIFSTFKDEFDFARDSLGPPPAIKWQKLVELWTTRGIQEATFHTLIVVALSLVIILIIASLAGFALAHLRVPGRPVFLAAAVILMVQPPALLMMPTFLAVYRYNLIDNFLGLALVYGGIVLPFATIMMYSYFRGLPKEIMEAAVTDGASAIRLYLSIGLPLAAPAFATLGTLVFIWLWNEFLFALLVLRSPDVITLVVALSTLRGDRFVGNFQEIAAGMLITMIPPLLIFAFLQRGLVRSIGAGAVRG